MLGLISTHDAHATTLHAIFTYKKTRVLQTGPTKGRVEMVFIEVPTSTYKAFTLYGDDMAQQTFVSTTDLIACQPARDDHAILPPPGHERPRVAGVGDPHPRPPHQSHHRRAAAEDGVDAGLGQGRVDVQKHVLQRAEKG